MTYILIPKEHQAAPKDEIYLPGQQGLYKSQTLLSDTDLRQGLKVEESRIHGLGLFADKYFPIHGVIWKETLRSNRTKIEDEGPLRWANHSDDPNSLLVLNLDGIIEASLVALKEIGEGEEITYDYNLSGHAGEKKACNCQQENCGGYFTVRTEFGEVK